MDPDYVIDSIEDGQGPSDPKVTYHKSACIVKCNPQGKIHLEGRVHDDYTGDLDEIHKQTLAAFSLETVQFLSLTLRTELLTSVAFKGLFPKQIRSLKAVEFVGENPTCTYPVIGTAALEVHVYQICTSLEPLEDDGTLLQAEIIQLPNLRFEGIWEKLVFNTDLRGNLIRLMTNMLNFSRALTNANQRARMNQLILLSGPPGTGKTTLCQALAQKLSIRLNCLYKETKLIQINAATLLSKFFSESAKHILQIFSAIEKTCHSHPTQFICVLIDEIESLASSRATASSHGEVHDTIRATNALLTGFDRVKSQPNLIVLCTSNMVDTLDAAFIDRCGHQIVIEPPSLEARYQILRDAIEELISAKIINTEDTVPCYRDAQLALLTEPKAPGSVLIHLCKLINIGSLPHKHNGQGIIRKSARFLGQLPEVALADRLITDTCSLDAALEYMQQFVFDNLFGLDLAVKKGILEDEEGPDRKRKREEPSNFKLLDKLVDIASY